MFGMQKKFYQDGVHALALQCMWVLHSGVARAFPGGQAAHLKDQNVDEN